MFYVKNSGEAVPSTGYKYIDSKSQELGNILENGHLPARPLDKPHYITFNKFENSATAIDKLQLPKASEGKLYNDAAYQVKFDTLQTIDELRIPNGKWGSSSYLEAMTQDFPEFGSGGATQAIYTKEINVLEVKNMTTGEIIYKGH
jgi:hypothetical protein